MALFDRLKEKVNKVVDIDKLSEVASKTVDSVKREITKAVDPSAKEQERLEKEKVLQEQKENAINDFFSSINLDEEIDYIFSVLQASGSSSSNFEKGVEHLLSKTKTALTKEDVLPILKKALFTRAFADAQYTVPLSVAIDYFMSDVVRGGLLTSYISFAVSREKGSYGAAVAIMEVPFVKTLYGIAGHALNYLRSRLGEHNYHSMAPDDFIPVIEDSTVLKSYTDEDPFAAHEIRKQWAEDMYNSPLELVHSSRLNGLLEKEEYMDALCYYTYARLCQDQEDRVENVSITKIASAYMNYLKEIYGSVKG